MNDLRLTGAAADAAWRAWAAPGMHRAAPDQRERAAEQAWEAVLRQGVVRRRSP